MASQEALTGETAITDGLRHIASRRDEGGLLWLTLDRRDSRTNTLDQTLLAELDTALDRLHAEKPRGLVIRSGKTSGFIAGADIGAFKELRAPAQARELIEQGQATLTKLARLGIPTVAAIHGYCLGGGYELALACRYRIATDDAKLGLPEVKLGIHPGFGGTVRLTRLIAAPRALSLMLSGATPSARTATQLGLVDDTVRPRHLATAATRYAHKRGRPRRPGWWWRPVLNAPGIRHAVAPALRRATAKQVRSDHYPAPFALIALWRNHGGRFKAMLRAEAESVADLITRPTARNLVRGFFLRERLKAEGKQSDQPPPQHVHVVGAGTMGGDIAAWCALQGLTVTLQDLDSTRIAPAIARADKLFRKQLRRSHQITAAHDRLVPDPEGLGARRCDLALEAIVEDAETKQNLYRGLEAKLPAAALLATNTSAIPLETLAAGLDRPDRLVGLHFFNPVARLPLVEVVAGTSTAAASQARAAQLVRAIDKLPLPVASAPGFLVNRALMPYILEAMLVLGEGSYSRSAIDRAALGFGMPMGPLHLADSVGLDVCAAVGERLSAETGIEVPRQLREMVDRGETGQKAGQGFYRYKTGRPQTSRRERAEAAEAATDTPLQDRLILPLVDAVLGCRRRGVVADNELADAGMLFGTGFAPFTGGPLAYAEARGWQATADRLAELSRSHGSRFDPDPGWSDGGTAPAERG